MKAGIRNIVLGCFAAGLCIASAIAGSQTFTSNGTIDSTMSFNDQWDITTPSTTAISSSGSMSAGGGGANVYYNGSIVLQYSVSGGSPGSGSVSSQPAGTYHLTHGGNGPTGTTYNFSTTFSW